MDHAHVEEDLGRVRDLLKLLQCGLELIVVVLLQGSHPRYDFLLTVSEHGARQRSEDQRRLGR